MIRALFTKTSKGIALVEVIAALGIAVVVITSLVSLSLFTLRSSLSSKLQLQGTKVATRESELIRSYRDNAGVPWASFVDAVKGCTDSSKCCMKSDGSGLQPGGVCTDGTGAELVTRSFTASKLDGFTPLASGDDAVRINIVATWTIGGQEKTTHLYTDLTNWRKSE